MGRLIGKALVGAAKAVGKLAVRAAKAGVEAGKKLVSKIKDKFSKTKKPNDPCETCPNAAKKPPLREAYESEVRDLKNVADKMKADGKSSEDIARKVHAARRELGEKYKDLTPPEKLAEIHRRNLEKYGDKLGPTIEHLRNKGKTWDEIIESASRPGGADLKF